MDVSNDVGGGLQEDAARLLLEHLGHLAADGDDVRGELFARQILHVFHGVLERGDEMLCAQLNRRLGRVLQGREDAARGYGPARGHLGGELPLVVDHVLGGADRVLPLNYQRAPAQAVFEPLDLGLHRRQGRILLSDFILQRLDQLVFVL